MSDNTPPADQLQLVVNGLTVAQVQELIRECLPNRSEGTSAGTNLTINFINLNIHQGDVVAKKESSETTYNQTVSGIAGAVAQGPGASAVSHGAVGHFQSLEPTKLTELLNAFAELKEQLKSVKNLPEEKRDETIQDLDKSKAAVDGPQRNHQEAVSIWQRVKEFVTGALAVGAFVGEAAAQVKALVEKITGILS